MKYESIFLLKKLITLRNKQLKNKNQQSSARPICCLQLHLLLNHQVKLLSFSTEREKERKNNRLFLYCKFHVIKGDVMPTHTLPVAMARTLAIFLFCFIERDRIHCRYRRDQSLKHTKKSILLLILSSFQDPSKTLCM